MRIFLFSQRLSQYLLDIMFFRQKLYFVPVPILQFLLYKFICFFTKNLNTKIHIGLVEHNEALFVGTLKFRSLAFRNQAMFKES